jgi:3-hydroxy acid dehydrogenase/malonic semialdehyde reductase
MKTVLITGASSGIGSALAHAYSRQGYSLVLAARRSARLEKLAHKLANPVHTICVDIADSEALQSSLADLPPGFRDIDILVNNAGVTIGEGPIHQRKLEDWNTMIDTNIRGLIQCTRMVLPGMVLRGNGHIVNLGSTAGTYPRPGNPIYCASKAFGKQFSLALRADLHGTGVRVTSIEPGTVQDTELAINRVGGDVSRLAEIYSGYEYLTPEDIARTIVWCTTVPSHVNVNRIDLMATCQTFSNLSSKRREAVPA